VIGLMGGCRYDQGGLALEPGDLFVAFTDGTAEAMDLAEGIGARIG
jgi:serine phosphatase RsbU (regulator of sigma subunit)